MSTPTQAKGRGRPFIPKRTAPEKSVYSTADYNADGSLKILRKVPDGPKLKERRETILGSSSRGDNVPPPTMQTTPKEGEETIAAAQASLAFPPGLTTNPAPNKYASVISKQMQEFDSASNLPMDEGLAKADAKEMHIRATEQADAAKNKPSLPEDRIDKVPEPANKHSLGLGKYDIETPENLRAPHKSQYIAVLRTIENRHPDEDRILQHYFLQYCARREGRYNPIDDPPVFMRDLLPTVCSVIDRVFSFDEVQGDGLDRLKKYIKSVASKTDMDVVPVTVNKAFHLPLHPETAFKYKHKVIDQIMQEWHESHEESASDILTRIERDREGRPAEKTPWHIYDGISPQGAFGADATTKIKELATNKEWVDPKKAEQNKVSWADQVDEEEEFGEDAPPSTEQEEEETAADWKTVAKKKKPPTQIRGNGQARRKQRPNRRP